MRHSGDRSDRCLQVRWQNGVDFSRLFVVRKESSLRLITNGLSTNSRSISTLITPLVASHLHLLILCRVVLGLGEGLGQSLSSIRYILMSMVFRSSDYLSYLRTFSSSARKVASIRLFSGRRNDRPNGGRTYLSAPALGVDVLYFRNSRNRLGFGLDCVVL